MSGGSADPNKENNRNAISAREIEAEDGALPLGRKNTDNSEENNWIYFSGYVQSLLMPYTLIRQFIVFKPRLLHILPS